MYELEQDLQELTEIFTYGVVVASLASLVLGASVLLRARAAYELAVGVAAPVFIFGLALIAMTALAFTAAPDSVATSGWVLPITMLAAPPAVLGLLVTPSARAWFFPMSAEPGFPVARGGGDPYGTATEHKPNPRGPLTSPGEQPPSSLRE